MNLKHALAPQVSALMTPTPRQLFRVFYWFFLALCFIAGVVLLILPDQRQQNALATAQSTREAQQLLTDLRPKMNAWSDAALKGFLEAKTLEERISHVMDAERVAPLMKAYYARKNDRQQGFPVPNNGFTFSRLFYHPHEKRLGAEIILKSVKPDGLLAMPVWRLGNSARVDWEYFAQYLEDYFEWFTSQPGQEGKPRFHVNALRSGEKDEEILILMGSSDFNHKLRISRDPSQPALEQLMQALPLDVKEPVYLELAWQRDNPAAEPRLTVSAFLSDGWGFNLPPVAEEAADLPTAEDAVTN